MGQDRSVLSPKERARITELQDALVDRLFERRGSPEFNGFSKSGSLTDRAVLGSSHPSFAVCHPMSQE
jgi:hypothetical protein